MFNQIQNCQRLVLIYYENCLTINNLSYAGTGKTIIVAFDYRNFRKKHSGEACQLLSEEDTGKKLTLANFLAHYHMDAREIYAKFSFARLSVLAGVCDDFDNPSKMY